MNGSVMTFNMKLFWKNSGQEKNIVPIQIFVRRCIQKKSGISLKFFYDVLYTFSSYHYMPQSVLYSQKEVQFYYISPFSRGPGFQTPVIRIARI